MAATVPDEVADKVKVIFLDVFDIIKYCKKHLLASKLFIFAKSLDKLKTYSILLMSKMGQPHNGTNCNKNL